MKTRSLLAVASVLLAPPAVPAQTTSPVDALGPVRSMGKPPVWKPFAGGYYGLDRSGETTLSGGGAFVGVYKDLLPSIVGVGVSGEAYLGGYSGASGVSGGFRAFAELRSLFLKVGVDALQGEGDTSFILSLTVPLRRGGLLGYGTHLRVDWLPGRGNSWNFGLQVPLEPHMGKTRPRDTEVDMPRAKKPRPRATPDPAVAVAIGEVRRSARGIVVLSTAFWPDDRSDRLKSLENSRRKMLEFKATIGARSAERPDGIGMASEVRILHDQLGLAFGLASGASAPEARAKGAPLADAARQAALDEVLYPYNRLFGQYKRPEELWGLVARARERFLSRLGESGLDGRRREAVSRVFDEYLDVLEDTRSRWVARLEADSRLAWLPLQLAMREEDHDTQEEIDAILSRATGTPLVGGNQVLYFNGQQFQVELHRTIHAAENYHVLWLHDYDGVDHAGNPDVIGYYISVEGYLQALTERVRAFDRTGKLPVYMILVDLNYWEANKGRLYTDVLQDPLGARPRLPKGDVAENRKLQEGIEKAQRDLREAVAASRRLQEEAARRGEGWLRRYVTVHLSVMNPADFSYRTSRLIGYLPIAPDTMVRDHRKIVFFDVTEADPGQGEAMYGGVGVGEQYATATWEDRAVRLRGPAALTLKDAARRYLKANGFADSDIPPPLQAQPRPADYGERVKALEAEGWTATAAQVHNDRGFARKDASIASAVLYTLMPPGSLIVVPDSIWTHELWAAHLVGAALRGCHVYVIAPAEANAPSAGFPQLARTREIFSRFVDVERILGPEIEARGGRLRAGLYTRQAGVDDIGAKLAEMHATFERYPFLREDFPFPSEFYDRLAVGASRVAAAGYVPGQELPKDAMARAPKMHRKTQLFVTRDALSALVRDRRTQEVIARQAAFAVEEGVVFDREGLAKAGVDLRPLFAPYLEAYRDLPSGVREHAVLYMTVGSLNKDARGMMTDGEVLQVTGGAWGMWAVSDMWMLMGSTTWLESQEELDRLLPPFSEWQRRVGRWTRKVI
jgi:hypothetical protein